jgi:antitoxin ParD1/3/4
MSKLSSMSKLDLELTEPLARFLADQVQSGRYKDASDVVRASLELLQAENTAREARLAGIQAAAAVGEDEIARGEGIVLDWDELDGWLVSLAAEAPQT